jgi:major membrane immunogen (membrane-anchored lipoprotein)
MKKLIIVLLSLSVVFSSCSSSKKSSSLFGSSNGFPKSTPKPTDDGLSFNTAIVITETNEGAGVKAEYTWIKNHYKDYTIKSQSLNMENQKPYDIIRINLAGNKELSLYFDISNYFGKF